MRNYYKILFGILLILSVFPAIQMFYPVVKEKPLNGVYIEQELPGLSFESWLSSDLQQKLNTFIDQNYGFRPFFIRLFNQVDFSLFRKAHGSGVVIGTQNYLYESWYIDAYTGKQLADKDGIKERIDKAVWREKDAIEKT